MNRRILFAGALVFYAWRSGIALEQPPQLAWSRQIGTFDYDIGTGVAIDSLNNSYLTGFSLALLGSPFGEQALLYKYDPSGNLLWTKPTRSLPSQRSNSVAVGGNNDVFIAGLAQYATDDAFLSKYNSAGSLLWTRQVNSNGNEQATSVAADHSGNSYVTGSTNGNLAGPNLGGYDGFLGKYDSAGNLLWMRQIGTAGYDSGNAIAVDSTGSLYVTGVTNGGITLPSGSGGDVLVAKFSSGGDLIWSRQFGSSTLDSGASIAIDSSGDLFITGSTYGNIGGPNLGRSDVFISKLTSTGAVLWSRQYGTQEDDYGKSVALDKSGNPLVLTSGLLLSKFATTGSSIWSKPIAAASAAESSGVVLDGFGNVLVAGRTIVLPTGLADAFLNKYQVPEPSAMPWIAIAGVAFAAWRLQRVRRTRRQSIPTSSSPTARNPAPSARYKSAAGG